ncbi:enoyl-CoA hydratase [Agaricicola taiwanensis]|uniref:Enoyl-CoA hydratase n=2 Tax=Agaricicola taiwanensis TaxID=591372 RepID=A0A8J2VIB2_9RHOB|nr:enoyl-CoA hydratase [Agaricicola taiwanensis]
MHVRNSSERADEASSAEVVVERISEGVTQLRLNRPERLNALGLSMVRNLRDAVEALANDGTRVLLIRGSGRAFCSGADLKERQTMSVDQRVEHNAAINAAIDAIAETPVPTIAVVNGLAFGGGCEVALACDMRVAALDALIGLTETRIGVIPGAGGTMRLPRLIGSALALEMMLSGEPVTAERAREMGLVNHAVPVGELDHRVAQLAALIASRSPLGTREIKRLVRDAPDLTASECLQNERRSLVRVVASEDYAEGLAAFAARRAPVFVGR